MSARTRSGRWLWRATIVSGVLAALTYVGGPIACTAKAVEMRRVLTPLHPGHHSALVMTRAGATGGTIVERIERGSLIELQLRPGAGVAVYECTLAGFDPVHGYILMTTDRERIEAVPVYQVAGLVVLGENSRGAHIGTGVLIGGLSGFVLGAAVGAETGGRQYGTLCAGTYGILLGGIGTGIGAGVGAAVPAQRARTEYPLGPGGWWIANTPLQPAAPPMPANVGGTR